MRLLRTLAALALPVALIAGCGDDDDGEGSTSEDPRTEEQLTADQALADRVVLTAEDVGPEWSVSEDDEEDEEDEDPRDQLLEDELTECLDVDPDDYPDDEDDDPEAEASFEQEQGGLEVSVGVADSVEELEPFFEVFGSEKFPDCYGKLLGDELRHESEDDEEAQELGVTYEGVEVSGLELPAGIGDGGFGVRATISIEVEGLPFESYQDLWFIQRGRVGIMLMTVSNFEPLPEEYTTGLLALMDERAAAA